jgi:colicin import membrane protein
LIPVSAVDELVPLHTDFDVVWRGCDRKQVQHYVERVEEELRLLTVDRDAAVQRADALADQLARSRADVRRLTERLEELSRTPIDLSTLTERLRRLVELAQAEAEEITNRARLAAEQDRATAQLTAERQRRRAEYLVAELDQRREELAAEHRELMARAHERVETLTREAAQRRRELDDKAAEIRHQIQTDFELAMTTRRTEAMKELEDQRQAARAERAAAKAESERLLAKTKIQATEMIAEAQAEVDRLHNYRDRVAATLRAAQRTLAAADPLLAPVPEENSLLKDPEQRARGEDAAA